MLDVAFDAPPGDAGRRPRRVTWLELFFDLAFVAAISQIGSALRDDFTPAGLLRFLLLLFLIWWAWLGHTTLASRLEADDSLERVLILFQMFVIAVMAANATGPLEGRDSAGFVAAYAVVRVVLVVQYWRATRIPSFRALARACACGHGIAAALWLTSALVPPPYRFWIWGAALSVELIVPALTTDLAMRAPHHPAHLPERYGLFTIILLGESFLAVMKGIEGQEYWSGTAVALAATGVSIVFATWWWYFDIAAGAADRPLRDRRDAVLMRVWTFAHFPLYLGIAVTGVGLEHVIAHAGVPDAAVLSLTGAGAFITLASVGAISSTARRARRVDLPRRDRQPAPSPPAADAIWPRPDTPGTAGGAA